MQSSPHHLWVFFIRRLEEPSGSSVLGAGFNTGGPDVAFDFGDYVMSLADKTMYENTLNIALNRTCIKDLHKNVLLYVCLTLF